jgi:hypothetical protein
MVHGDDWLMVLRIPPTKKKSLIYQFRLLITVIIFQRKLQSEFGLWTQGKRTSRLVDFFAKVWTIGCLLVTWSISNGAQYVTLDSKIKCLCLAVFSLATPPNEEVTEEVKKLLYHTFCLNVSTKSSSNFCFCLHGKLYEKLYKHHECE